MSEPYFHNPCPLAFDPVGKSMDTLDGGVSLHQVWADDVARTCWLAVKARHLTDQYFRECCLANARDIRTRKPDSPQSLAMIFHGPPSCREMAFFEQLFPYIVAAIQGDAPNMLQWVSSAKGETTSGKR